MHLSIDTACAMVFTGPWHEGKTRYFPETFLPQIRQTYPFQVNHKHYHPVMISLFGQKSIDDIQDGIFATLIPLAKNKITRLGFDIIEVFF